MIKHVMFVNQNAAENNVGMPNWAVISITDRDKARIKEGWHSVRRYQFSDVDMKHAEHEREMMMSEKQALELVSFVHEVAPQVEGILVHCKGGISRSAAVAKWIAKSFGLPFDHQYALFNTLVFERLNKAAAIIERAKS